MTTHEVLVAARNLLDRGPWFCAGLFTQPGNCLSTALYESGDSWDAHSEVARILGIPDSDRKTVPTLKALYAWNDSRQSKGEVLALLDKAIAATAPPPPDLAFSELVEAGAVA